MDATTAIALIVAIGALLSAAAGWGTVIHQRTEAQRLLAEAQDRRVDDRVDATIGKRLIEIDQVAQQARTLVQDSESRLTTLLTDADAKAGTLSQLVEQASEKTTTIRQRADESEKWARTLLRYLTAQNMELRNKIATSQEYLDGTRSRIALIEHHMALGEDAPGFGEESPSYLETFYRDEKRLEAQLLEAQSQLAENESLLADVHETLVPDIDSGPR